MRKIILSLLLLTGSFAQSQAHEPGEARYIANEAVLVGHGEIKILFDPLPLTGFGTYPDVPQADREAMLAGQAPYDGIDAVFISHAHRDHFSADAMNQYMATQTDLRLIAPEQAVTMMKNASGWENGFAKRIAALDLAFQDAPVEIHMENLDISAVRIPHSGWPGRADVQNLVYRITLDEGITVAHMGDADINMTHYSPYKAHWDERVTDMAFPPYWIYLYPNGADILKTMNVRNSVGIHVPIKVPHDLKNSGADFFSVKGETRTILPAPTKPCSPVSFDGADFTVCEFKASDDIRLFWGEGTKPYGSFDKLDEVLEAEGKVLVMAMNGGMYHSDRRPVGYYLENGVQRQKLMTKASTGNFGLLPNGVFHIGPDGVGVTETRAFEKQKLDVHSASQSGPMLVIDGALHPVFRKESDSRKRRNGVGVDGDTVYFAISEEPVNFHHFARLFRDHLGTPNALYLDGVVSRLFDAENNRNDSGFRMGPIVGVVR